jgi:CBS domain-containing protein
MLKIDLFSLKIRILDALDIMKKEQVEVIPVINDNILLLGVVTVICIK